MDSAIGSVIVAIISGLISLGTAVFAATMARESSRERGRLEKELARMKQGFDMELGESRARLDQKAEYSAERAVTELLLLESQSTRKWSVIRATIGGFNDAELRKVLVRAGAIRMRGPNNEERWGLLARNRDFLVNNRFLREVDRNPEWETANQAEAFTIPEPHGDSESSPEE